MADVPAIRETDLEDADDIAASPWALHDWTGEEITFAGEYLQHGNLQRAYLAAHPDFHMVDGKPLPSRKPLASVNGSRLAKQPWMASYLAYVRKAMIGELIMGKDEVLARLSSIARANQADFFVLQEDGTPVPDFSGLTREQIGAISELTVETYVLKGGDMEGREVRSVKVKLAPAIAALELIGKHHRLFADVLEDNRETDVAARMRALRRNRPPAEESET